MSPVRYPSLEEACNSLFTLGRTLHQWAELAPDQHCADWILRMFSSTVVMEDLEREDERQGVSEIPDDPGSPDA